VGEDEIQRNNQEISRNGCVATAGPAKSGKEREECGLSATEVIAVAHPWILKREGPNGYQVMAPDWLRNLSHWSSSVRVLNFPSLPEFLMKILRIFRKECV